MIYIQIFYILAITSKYCLGKKKKINSKSMSSRNKNNYGKLAMKVMPNLKIAITKWVSHSSNGIGLLGAQKMRGYKRNDTIPGC